MTTNGSSSGLPPILAPSAPPSRQAPAWNLRQVLLSILGKPGWDGVPTGEVLASAIRAACDMAEDSDQRHKVFNLLETLKEAIEGGTADGWKLELTGRKGPRRTFEDDRLRSEIGDFMADTMSPGCYESVAKAAAVIFDSNATTAKECYAEHKRETEEWLRIVQALQEHLDDKIACLKADLEAGPRE